MLANLNSHSGLRFNCITRYSFPSSEYIYHCTYLLKGKECKFGQCEAVPVPCNVLPCKPAFEAQCPPPPPPPPTPVVNTCTVIKRYMYTCLQMLARSIGNAPVTRAYVRQRTPTYGNTSGKLIARFI